MLIYSPRFSYPMFQVMLQSALKFWLLHISLLLISLIVFVTSYIAALVLILESAPIFSKSYFTKICILITLGNTTLKSPGHTTPLFNVMNSEPSGNNATLEPSYMITSILPSQIVTALKPSVRKRTSILSRDIEISSERMTVNLKLSGQFTTQKSSGGIKNARPSGIIT